MRINHHPLISDASFNGSVHDRPGFSPTRLAAIARERIAETRLDLRDRVVLTEAATGVYVITPILAALAGASRVYAFAKDSRHGTKNEAIAWLHRVAEVAGVAGVISIIDQVPDSVLRQTDIITNSGHLRPIDEAMISALPPHAVVALMFEAWERREADLDIEACRRKGIVVVGVNERHETVDVFSFLGPLAVRLLHDAGLAVYRTRVALLCDNDFNISLLAGLVGQGAFVDQAARIEDLPAKHYEAVVVALQPSDHGVRFDRAAARHLAKISPNAIVAQLWGDIDRAALRAHNLSVWPPIAPTHGHMAILLSAIGPEPVARLQAGGLKAAELALRRDKCVGETLHQII